MASKTLLKKIESLADYLDVPVPKLARVHSGNSMVYRLPLSSTHTLYLNDTRNYREDLYHEFGHVHFDNYFGSVISRDDFAEAFGNPSKFYYGAWYFMDDPTEEIEEDSDFVSLYAQVHPKEDYAETFAFALEEILHKKRFVVGRGARKKITLVKRWIRS